MFKQYFQEELAAFKNAAGYFSKKHPAIAPMLGKTSTDPDVKALFEGAAFLTGLIKEKIEDDFPEIIYELTRMFLPHYLKPLPSNTIIKFTPSDNLNEPQTIPAGTYINSIPVNGAVCRFKTCYDIEINPLKLLEASYQEHAGKPAYIKMLFELNGVNALTWEPNSIDFFISGSYEEASDIYLHLITNLNSISIRLIKSGEVYYLSPDNLRPMGFSEEEALIPYPSNAFRGYRLLQEYFFMPEKFLFLKLLGWENWNPKTKDTKFEICFELKDIPSAPLKIDKEIITLFATPAINIFKGETAPVILDHKRSEYEVMPAKNTRIYSIENIIGITKGNTSIRKYAPFHKFGQDKSLPVYNEILKYSHKENSIDTSIRVAYPENTEFIEEEVLSFDALCTNGNIPQNLLPEDIRIPTENSPEFASFTNITKPTTEISPKLDNNFLWKMLSHLYLNYTSISNAESLKALLNLYIPEDNSVEANNNRIKGIENIYTKRADRFIDGDLLRGRDIIIKMDSEHFSSKGDMYIFGSVLDVFFGLYASINTFTKLIMEDKKGETYSWRAKIGNQHLI